MQGVSEFVKIQRRRNSQKERRKDQTFNSSRVTWVVERRRRCCTALRCVHTKLISISNFDWKGGKKLSRHLDTNFSFFTLEKEPALFFKNFTLCVLPIWESAQHVFPPSSRQLSWRHFICCLLACTWSRLQMDVLRPLYGIFKIYSTKFKLKS